MCTHQDISNIPFIMRRIHFLVHGHKKDLPHFTCIFHLLKYVVKFVLVLAILHHISLLRLLPKSYFKISTFQPNFLCSSSFYTWKHGALLFVVECVLVPKDKQYSHLCKTLSILPNLVFNFCKAACTKWNIQRFAKGKLPSFNFK